MYTVDVLRQNHLSMGAAVLFTAQRHGGASYPGLSLWPAVQMQC